MQSGLVAIALLCVFWCVSHLSGWKPQLHAAAEGVKLCARHEADPRRQYCLQDWPRAAQAALHLPGRRLSGRR